MAGEWLYVPISQVATAVIGGTPSRSVPAYWGGDIPWATARDVASVSGRYLEHVEDYITWEGLEHSAAKLLPAGTVVITSRGTVGAVAQLGRAMAFNQTCYALLPSHTFDNEFLFYALKGTIGEMRALTYGTVFETITTQTFDHWLIPLPPLSEQRAIAHILGTLDDKIELNRRMSETLEAMARALFKAWFVDFEPVRAKMEGRWRQHSPLPMGEGLGVREKPRLNPKFLAFARELRRQSTDAEQLLWRLLRNRQVAGAKFRRQHPMPPYILDFYCHEARLAIELDGGQHNEPTNKQRDAERDALLAENGIRVLRFWNHEVLGQTEAVLETIHAALEEALSSRQPSPQPLSQGERGFYLPAHLYDLFPDRLVESEVGEIPEGWEVKPISDLAEVVGGSTPKTECAEFWECGTHHWVTPKDLSGLSMPVLLDTERKITDAGLAQISSGLLPRGTVLLSSRAPIGYLAIAEVPVAVNQGFIAMKPRQGVSNLFLLRWARAAHDEILSHANGSTFQEISKASFRPIRVVTPPTPVMDAFDQLSRPMYCKVVENLRESRTLAALRDALLPKLISGELRVKDAERFLKERRL